MFAVGVIAVAAVWYVRRPMSGGSETAATSTAAAFAQSRLELAERSLQARQYRDAQRYADDVLATAPDHQRARAVRDHAGALLRQAGTNIEDARKMIQAGDVRGAVRALDEARTIDPVAPGLAEVSQLMADRFKSQAQAAEAELQRSRAAPAPAQRPVPLPAPQSPAGSSRSVVAVPPAPDTPRDVPPASTAPARPTPPPVAAAAEPLPRTEPAESAAVNPSPSPVAPPAERKATAEIVDDDSAIRAVVSAYARAIESKDLALFRSIKPNLGADEERRIQQGFRAVTSQKVNITVTSIDRRNATASVQLRRQDIIEAGGRRQSSESRQTMTLAKSNGTWVIVEIGR